MEEPERSHAYNSQFVRGDNLVTPWPRSSACVREQTSDCGALSSQNLVQFKQTRSWLLLICLWRGGACGLLLATLLNPDHQICLLATPAGEKLGRAWCARSGQLESLAGSSTEQLSSAVLHVGVPLWTHRHLIFMHLSSGGACV